jgi:hypothetical protein
VPNAQHAFRQGKLLARNIAATLHGHAAKPYVHHSLGSVPTLGLGHGIFQYKKLTITGVLRLADAPRLPRARRAGLGTQGARLRRLGGLRAVRPRHRLARLGRTSARRVRFGGELSQTEHLSGQ